MTQGKGDYSKAWRTVRLAAIVAAMIAVLAFVLQPRIVVLCRGRLVEVEQPADWRRLAEIPDVGDDAHLGPFLVRGRASMPKYGLGLQNATLTDPELCAAGGVSLAGWFEHGPPPAYARSPGELYLRRDDSGVFVVSAHAWSEAAPPEAQAHVVSFRRQLGTRLSFVSGDGRTLGLVLALGFVASAGGAAHGWRRIRRLGSRAGDTQRALTPHEVGEARRVTRLARASLVVGFVAVAYGVARWLAEQGTFRID